jgi:hypothetical protein
MQIGTVQLADFSGIFAKFFGSAQRAKVAG